METQLKDKVALITGGTQGIGRAIAVAVAKSGAAGIALVGRNPDRGADAAREISSLGVPAHFIPAELGGAEAPSDVLKAAFARFERIDLLVNAAADTNRGTVAAASPDFFDRLYAVNVRTPLFLMQGVINHLAKRRAPGSIVNILSMNAHGGTPDLAIYASTKAALALLTKNAAFSHRFDRIRINGINVGWADTPAERQMQAVTLGLGEDWLARANAAQPSGSLLLPEDVARLALFLLSDASAPMTGSLIDQEQGFVIGVRE
ncbi:short-chain dehydrogenase [Labrys miyagiensis]|uniref:Short-chain dehydrogenase n=1 Tax=Labrys miyagiensis TaxID=346912 RepID=A0ABQ6CI92_9HYPH|nr:SDR family oxidoreductase [Labrys miyagiensis]GLS19357.1 short-chain dehydrogenase [Labrys miyagiensis]